MKTGKYSNTKEKGVLHFYVLQKGSKDEYIAVCWNFNLIEYGPNPEELLESIQEGALSYLKAVRTKKLSNEYLNQSPPKDIVDLIHKGRLLADLYQRTNEISTAEIQKVRGVDPSESFLQFLQTPYKDHYLAL